MSGLACRSTGLADSGLSKSKWLGSLRDYVDPIAAQQPKDLSLWKLEVNDMRRRKCTDV